MNWTQQSHEIESKLEFMTMDDGIDVKTEKEQWPDAYLVSIEVKKWFLESETTFSLNLLSEKNEQRFNSIDTDV